MYSKAGETRVTFVQFHEEIRRKRQQLCSADDNFTASV